MGKCFARYSRKYRSMKRRLPNISKINTRILRQIVDRDGTTEHNTDYGPLLDEIRQELYRRYETEDRRTQKAQEKALGDHILHTQGRQCTHCHQFYPLDTIEENFYKVKTTTTTDTPTRYRPRCKACHVTATRRRRGRAEISISNEATTQSNDHGIDEIPF